MANAQTLTPAQYMTLADVVKFKNPDGSILTQIIDEYSTVQTLGAEIPAVQASDAMEDNGSFLEPWEYDKTSKTTDLDGGSQYFKIGTYQRKDIMGMRSSAIGINERQYLMAGEAGKFWRAQQTLARSKHIALDKEHDMFYGDPSVDPNQNLGLAPRFCMCTDTKGIIKRGEHKGKMSPYITIDAGGTSAKDGNLASIYILYLSPVNGVCWLYPKDSAEYSAGLRYVKGDFMPVKELNSQGVVEVRREASDIFEVVGGIGMRSRRAGIRIANIDVTTEEGMKKFDEALYRAFSAMPMEFRRSAKIYSPTDITPDLKMYYRDHFTKMSYDQAKPMNLVGDFTIDGYLFREVDHLLATEDYLA